MTTPEPGRDLDGEAMLRAAGIDVTESGKARWRTRLGSAQARWTAERHAALRRQLGLPEKAA